MKSALLGFAAVALVACGADIAKGDDRIPTFRYDPAWPRPLPNNWIIGNVGAIHVDKSDHVWVIQRPSTTTGLGERDLLNGQGECCTPAPPVIEFDPAGKLVQSRGPIHITDPATKMQRLLDGQVSPPYPDGVWPALEHAIFVDHKDNVWIAGSSEPSQVLKLSHDGKFLMRIGTEEAKSSNDRNNLAGPAAIYVDPRSNEVFVADGYRNRRVVVFDADSGAYKRHWGAYGKKPPEGQEDNDVVSADQKAQREHFATVHCLAASNDGLLYVCDRVNSRVQVFTKDGKYLDEVYLEPTAKGFGTAFAIAFSADSEQKFIYVGDGSNKKVHIVRRSDLKVVGSFGTAGREGGRFLIIHAIATDSHGNVYVGESVDGNRVQRFLFTGMQPASQKQVRERNNTVPKQ